MEHSIIPPSSAAIWGAPNGCPGWVTMTRDCPNEETEYTRAGNAAHHLAAKCLMGYTRGVLESFGVASFLDGQEGVAAPNGVCIDRDIIDSVRVYVDDAVSQISPRHQVHIEKRIEIPRVHAESFGHVDCYAYDKEGRDLIIWDFKHGWGKVEVFENWQLINYAAGILDELGVDGFYDKATTVRFRIVQPRAYHREGPIRKWSVLASDLRGYFNILIDNARKAVEGTGGTHSGPHCKYCRARYKCDAAWEAGVSLYEAILPLDREEPSADELSRRFTIVQRAVAHLDALKIGLEEQIKALIRSGAQVPGYRAEAGYGREQWIKSDSEVAALGTLLGLDFEKKSVITPNQARKLGLDSNILKKYAARKQTGVKLIPEDTERAKQIFGDKTK